MKKITLKTATSYPISGKTWQSSLRCEGLDEQSDSLISTKMPDVIATLPSGHCLEYIDVRAGLELFITSSPEGLWLWAWRPSTGNKAINILQSKILTIDADIKNMISVGDFMIVHTSTDLYYLKYTHLTYVRMQIADALPQVWFCTANETTRTVTMPQLSFPTPVASWNTALDTENVDAVKKRMEKALSQLEDEAVSRGEWLQPQLIRYILTDNSDNVIFASAPVMVGCGLQGNNAITSNAVANGNLYTGIEKSIFSMKGFGITMKCIKGIDKEWRNHISTLKVLISDYRAPFTGVCNITMNSVGVGNYSLTASLNTIDAESYAHFALSSFEWREIASFPSASINNNDTHILYDDSNGKKSYYNSDEIDTKAVNILNNSLPDAITSYNGMLIRAGEHTRGLPLWNPVELVQGIFSEMPCTLQITLFTSQYFGGDMRHTYSFNLPFTPSKISPVISILGSGIESATLQIASVAGIFRKEYPLNTISRNFCCNINKSLAPTALDFNPSDEIISYPDISPQYIPAESYIISSEQNNPFTLRYKSNVGITGVSKIIPTQNRVTSGIFTHLPLYVFSESGVYACTYEPVTNASRNPRRLSAIEALASVATPDMVYFADGRNLYYFNSGRFRIAVPDINAESLQFLHPANSLIVLTSDGNIDIYNSEKRYHRIPVIKARKIIAAHSGSVIAISNSNDIVEFSAHNTHFASDVTLVSHPIEINEAVKSVLWDICGTELNLRLNIYGMAENTTNLPRQLLASYILKGASQVPVITPVDAPFFSRIAIEIIGKTYGNLSISKIIINPKL